MDVEKAIKLLKEWIDRDREHRGMCRTQVGLGISDFKYDIKIEERNVAIETVINSLEKQLTNRWIPTSERLPEKNKHVLLFLRNSEGKEIQVVGYLYFSEKEELKAYNNEFSVFDGEDMPEFLIQRYVKAWRPLPEPYKEVD